VGVLKIIGSGSSIKRITEESIQLPEGDIRYLTLKLLLIQVFILMN